MKNNSKKSQQLLALLGLFFVVTLTLAGCITIVSNPGATVSNVNEAYKKTLKLSNQSSDIAGIICNYGPQQFDVLGKTQTKTVVYGTGPKPKSVQVTRSLGSQPGSAPLASRQDGWSASGNGLNCSILSCPSGSYSVAVGYNSSNSCPDAIILELQIPN